MALTLTPNLCQRLDSLHLKVVPENQATYESTGSIGRLSGASRGVTWGSGLILGLFVAHPESNSSRSSESKSVGFFFLAIYVTIQIFSLSSIHFTHSSCFKERPPPCAHLHTINIFRDIPERRNQSPWRFTTPLIQHGDVGSHRNLNRAGTWCLI